MISYRGRGRIVTPDARATRTGQDVLDNGGSAVDAVIAASAVLCVVYPHNVTLGGDTWTLVDPPGADPVAVNGTGRAPAALSADLLREQGLHAVPGTGPHSISVPGLVAAWGELHQRWGSTPFGDLIDPARRFADDGASVAPALARDLAKLAGTLAEDPGCASVFFGADGAVWSEGDLLRQPALAQTLQRIAEQGPAALYGGGVGRSLADGLHRAGSMITADDLANHRTDVVAPISTGYRGLEVLTSPPSSQGFTMLKILRLMEELGVADPLAEDQVALIMDAVALAGEERDEVSADPDFVEVDVDAVLGPGRVAEQAAVLRAEHPPAPAAGPRPPLGGDTIGMVAVDGDGCWVSSIQSVAGTFGSQVLEPTTGILAHNRGSGFSLDPDHPGYLVGGRRPPHTLMPCLVRRDGQTVGALATMGGHNQPFILTQVLARILAGDHPQQAVAAPRWVVPRGGPTGRVVIADERVPAEVLAELSADASIEVVSMIDNRLGHSHAIWDTPDGWAAGTDPRADGEPG
jgi:gamma-glutamyltranspeptidase/glutathione hydrolase